MNQPAHYSSLAEARVLGARPLHLAIGMFDGVHRGHREVVGAAIRAARQTGGLAAVLTFWPHPSVLFRPDDPTPQMQDAETKARVLLSLGIDAVITETFTPEIAGVAAEEFLQWLKSRLAGLSAVYVGENFRFGRGRLGEVGVLADTAKKIGLTAVIAPRLSVAGEPISSTRIRRMLASGEMATANELLGYTYFAEGVVAAGKQLGRTIGFPTLNIPWAPGLRPRYGVYAVRVSRPKSGAALPAVANYGLRPTVEQTTAPRLEVHVLGDCPFGTGDLVRVEWLRFVRPERKFSGVSELREQIAKDRMAVSADFSLH